MVAEIGQASLVAALVAAGYGVLALALGSARRDRRWVESGRAAVRAVAALVTLASAVLFYLLATGDFSVAYVVRTTTLALPLFYKLAAFWGGQAGSLLLWLWVLAGYAWLVDRLHRGPEQEGLVSRALALLLGVTVFWLVLVTFVSRPFARLAVAPADGTGLNPLLQHPAMAGHPLALYLGFVGFAVPWAFAMAALWQGDGQGAWIRVTRKWTLAAWLFLSWGILLGGRWAYVVLGWGGYWGWDPVENASLLPWLTATAFLHSAIVQERRGMFKAWNVGLITATFLLTVFGTFITRTGVVSSVHAFARSAIGPWFLGLLAVLLIGSVALIFARSGCLRDEQALESAVSKETGFLLNNLVLAGWAFAVFWGVVFPMVAEALRGVRVSVGPPFYNQVSVPLAIALVFLMGAGPLIAWRRSSWTSLRDNFAGPLAVAAAGGVVLALLGARKPAVLLALVACLFVAGTLGLEFVRATRVRMAAAGEGPWTSLAALLVGNRRRYGGYLVHLAILLIVAGVAVSGGYRYEVDWTNVVPGQALSLPHGYQLVYEGLYERYPPHMRGAVYAELRVLRDGRPVAFLRPQKQFHVSTDFEGNDVTTGVALLSTAARDLYVVLTGWSEDGRTASFRVDVNPMVVWLWVGGFVLSLGAGWALWPAGTSPAAVRGRVRERVPVTVAAPTREPS